MKIYVKNMFSQKSVLLVSEEMSRLGIKHHSIEFGEIDFDEAVTLKEIFSLDLALHKCRMELIFVNSNLVSEIRNLIMDLVKENVSPGTDITNHFTGKLGYNYSYLNMYFTIETGLSIDNYYTEKCAERLTLVSID